jgi:hypothetical protein
MEAMPDQAQASTTVTFRQASARMVAAVRLAGASKPTRRRSAKSSKQPSNKKLQARKCSGGRTRG